MADSSGNDHSRIGYGRKTRESRQRIPGTRVAVHRLSHLEIAFERQRRSPNKRKEVNHMGLAILPLALIFLMIWALWAVNHPDDE